MRVGFERVCFSANSAVRKSLLIKAEEVSKRQVIVFRDLGIVMHLF